MSVQNSLVLVSTILPSLNHSHDRREREKPKPKKECGDTVVTLIEKTLVNKVVAGGGIEPPIQSKLGYSSQAFANR